MIAAVIGALILAAQAAGPADTAATPPAATGPAKASKPQDDPQKVVCKTETVVGSLIPSRVCRTKSDWDAMTESGRKSTQDAQVKALTRPTFEQSKGP
jgi:hypothetical protein